MYTFCRVLAAAATLAGAIGPQPVDHHRFVRVAQAWIRIDAARRPVEFGLSFDGAALDTLAPGSTETIVSLPVVPGLRFRTIVVRLAGL